MFSLNVHCCISLTPWHFWQIHLYQSHLHRYYSAKFDKELFGMDKDLLLGNVYLPPHNSPYAHEDMFTDIETSILDLRYTDYNLIIVGDFNAHTSTKQDYVDLPDETTDDLGVRNCTDLFELYNCKVHRSNQDKTKCDTYGSKLLQLCKTAGICIFNGRVTGDEEGSPTTSKCTTIDYVVGSPSVLPFVKGMRVEDFDQIYSDVHNKVIVTFNQESTREKVRIEPNVSVRADAESRKLNRWTIDKTQLFVENLDQNQLVDILELLSDQNNSTTEITNRITEALMSSAEKTLGYRNPTPLKSKNSDKECRTKKKLITGQ